MTVRITEADLARDVQAALNKVQEGDEVIIEREDHSPVAVIRAPHRSGRPIIQILEEAKRRKSTVTLDKNFSRDLEEIIASHQQHGIRRPGLVLDSSTAIAAERRKASVPDSSRGFCKLTDRSTSRYLRLRWPNWCMESFVHKRQRPYNPGDCSFKN